ncbi:unnamed protein product [Leptidea sinapis]|uniref:Uncharacterized protein n=1 Tax=Leptidea sinapis TaxID=189913 RepID=A0A5E4PQI1_9NEOP|nr:unnamed protein product [Leptidea sinapis]
MRGAGCTINDLWDRDIDAQVERTKNRPLVSGVISQKQAVGFLAAQLSLSLGILLQLNCYSIVLGASTLQGQVDPAVCIPLYTAAMAWTDKIDDSRIGIKSTALTRAYNTDGHHRGRLSHISGEQEEE